MKILIDIGHPAHVHLFKHFAWEMLKKGHEVLFTAREKEVALQLLAACKFPYRSFGKPYKTVAGKLRGLIQFDLAMFRTARQFQPDIFLSHGSFYAAHAAYLFRKPHISFEDTGNNEQVRLYKPFTDAILTPDTFYKGDYGDRQVRYKGFHELAYLHPNYFKADPEILPELNISKTEKFVLLRFVSWNASHDLNQQGLTYKDKIDLVQTISLYARVFISSEAPLPPELETYRLAILPEKIHHVMAFASLFVGEGSTMAIESAVLGTPAVYINTITGQPLEDLEENYRLLWGFRNSRGVREKVIELLTAADLNTTCKINQEKLFEEKIDVTRFFSWFIETYPESKSVMLEDPEYQNRFIRVVTETP